MVRRRRRRRLRTMLRIARPTLKAPVAPVAHPSRRALCIAPFATASLIARPARVRALLRMRSCKLIQLHRLLRPPAEIVDQADLAARLSREAGVAAVQDQPVM